MSKDSEFFKYELDFEGEKKVFTLINILDIKAGVFEKGSASGNAHVLNFMLIKAGLVKEDDYKEILELPQREITKLINAWNEFSTED